MGTEAISYFPNALADSTVEKQNLSVERSDQPTDESLLLEVSQGSKDALGGLYDRLSRSVYVIAARILRDRAEAEDLVHEVFLSLSRSASHFDPTKGSARTWIIHTAYTRALNRRGFLNVRNHYDPERPPEDRMRASYIDQEQLSVDRLTAQRLAERFQEVLSPDQRRTLEMHFFEGCTFREIAEEVGVPLDTIRKQYYRGCQKLRTLIHEQKDARRD